MGAPSLPPGRYFLMHMVGYSRGSPASAALPGGVRTRCRCAIFCGWRAGRAPVGYIVEKLARHWDAATWRMADGKQPHQAAHLKIDASKAQVRLGWHPRLATDLALDWTAAWYRRQQDGASARDLCLDQIQRFQKQDGR